MTAIHVAAGSLALIVSLLLASALLSQIKTDDRAGSSVSLLSSV
ncbi:MAG: hypothetical protein WBC68_07080 [Albidovulum sp.]